MKRIEERKFSMYEVTRDLLLGTAAEIIAAMPLMADYTANLVSNIISISNFGGTQSLNRKGIANDKGSLKNILITKATDVARKVQGFAVNNNDLVLLKEVKYSESSLNRLPDNILVIVCNIIYDKAKANLAALAPYGVDDSVIVDLRKAIDNYDVSIPKPRTGIVTPDSADLQSVPTINSKQI